MNWKREKFFYLRKSVNSVFVREISGGGGQRDKGFVREKIFTQNFPNTNAKKHTTKARLCIAAVRNDFLSLAMPVLVLDIIESIEL